MGLQLPWVDWAGLVLLLIFGLLGAWRGLWWQLFRCLAVALSLGLARALSPLAAGKLLSLLPTLKPGLLQLLCFLAIFVVAIKLASLLGKAGASALNSLQLGPLDRLAGLLLGLVTGLALHAAAVVGLRTLGPSVWAQETLVGSRSEQLADRVVEDLAVFSERWPHIVQHLRAALERAPGADPTGTPTGPPPGESAPPAGAGGDAPPTVR
jgi:uncharacterized membrane protein required for colicin V production